MLAQNVLKLWDAHSKNYQHLQFVVFMRPDILWYRQDDFNFARDMVGGVYLRCCCNLSTRLLKIAIANCSPYGRWPTRPEQLGHFAARPMHGGTTNA